MLMQIVNSLKIHELKKKYFFKIIFSKTEETIFLLFLKFFFNNPENRK